MGKQSIWEDQRIGKRVHINGYDQLLTLKEVIREEDKYLRIQCAKLVMDLNGATDDMIRFSELPHAGYLVSDRLKNAIEQQHFTGMDFVEISDYSKRIEIK